MLTLADDPPGLWNDPAVSNEVARGSPRATIRTTPLKCGRTLDPTQRPAAVDDVMTGLRTIAETAQLWEVRAAMFEMSHRVEVLFAF